MLSQDMHGTRGRTARAGAFAAGYNTRAVTRNAP